MKKKTFYIVDGHSQIFRAYYAPAAFRNRSQGLGAAFIFTRMLLKLLDKGKPDAIVCALDSSGSGDVRAAYFPEYKAHREPMPEDLAEQMPTIRKLIEAIGIPVVEGGDHEADDVIGTLTKQAEKAGYQVRLVSRDKDLKQLLSENVYLFDLDDGSLYGPDELKTDTGLEPEQFIDYLALMGDTSDGIPGATGVGPVRAQELLKKFGTLEKVLAGAEEIPQPKLRENLIAFRKQAPVSKKLATIITDMKLPLKVTDAGAKPPQRETLAPILKELGFRSILSDLGWADAADEATAGGVRTAAATDAKSGSTGLRATVAASAAVSAAPKKARGKRAASGPTPDMFGSGAATAVEEDSPTAAPSKDAHLAEQRRGTYTLIDDAKKLKDFIAQLKKQKRIAWDTETTSIEAVKAQMVGTSFSWNQGEGWYIAVRGPQGEKVCDLDDVLKAIKPVLEDPKVEKVGQNLKYDILVVKKYGIDVRGVAFDTMIAAYLADNTRQEIGLDRLAFELLNGYECIPITTLIGADKKKQLRMDQAPVAKVAEYAAEDADISLRVASVLAPELKEKGIDKLAYELEMPLVEVLAHMEHVGIAIDVPYLKKLEQDFAERIEEAEKACYRAAKRDFTIGSPQQLAIVLYDELGLAPKGKTAGGARSTAQDVLEGLAHEHPLPKLVLEYRHLSKLKSTYIDALPELADEKGRVHTTFRQAVATGRLASNDPNVQNIPVRSEEGRKIRKAFVAGSKDTRLIVADYSQIELRILAHLCGDKSLQQAFKDGRDIHRAVASEVNGVAEEKVSAEMRSHVKAIHFGILYGQSAFGLSQAMGISKTEAQAFIDKYFKKYPKVQKFIADTHDDAQRKGYVSTILGRRRYIAGINDANRMRQSHALRQAFNTVVQGSAADLIKTAMLRVHARIRDEKLPYQLLIQVHDELLLEAPAKDAEKAAKFLTGEMEGAIKLDVPITADVGIGKNWLDAKA